MDRFIPGFSGLKRGIDLIMFGKQSILPCASFYESVGISFLCKGQGN